MIKESCEVVLKPANEIRFIHHIKE